MSNTRHRLIKYMIFKYGTKMQKLLWFKIQFAETDEEAKKAFNKLFNGKVKE